MTTGTEAPLRAEASSPDASPPSSLIAGPPLRILPFDPKTVLHRFVRGRERPQGVAWFGIRSFWGHLRHFVASAIATEDVDSRDWMTPDEPRALMERVSRLLGGSLPGTTVTERLGKDVWIDYIADTGDDVSVSRAVARRHFESSSIMYDGRRIVVAVLFSAWRIACLIQ